MAAQIFRNCLNDFFQDEASINTALEELIDWHKKMQIEVGTLDSPILLALLTELYGVSPDAFRQISNNRDIYREVQDMVTEKLIQKLVKEGMVETKARESCIKYLETFQETAFECFCHRRFTLPNDAVTVLKSRCIELNLPPELMLLTYLNVRMETGNPESNKEFMFWDTKFLAHNIAIHLAKKIILAEGQKAGETSMSTSLNGANKKDKQKKGILKSIKSKFTKSSQEQPKSAITFTNIIKKTFIEEYLKIHKKSGAINEAQNILLTDVFMTQLLFIIGAIKYQQESLFTDVAKDCISLLVEKTYIRNSGISDVNNLLLMVSESGQNDSFVKCAAEYILKVDEAGAFVIDEGSFTPFRHVLNVAVPKTIGITVEGNPAQVTDLVETLQDIATKNTDVALIFKHQVYHIDSTASDVYLQTLTKSTLCRVTQYRGLLNDLQILPPSLVVLHLHLNVEQLPDLNRVLQKLGSLRFLGIVLICGEARPSVDSISNLEVPDQIELLTPEVAANLNDDDTDVSYAIDILKKLCPKHYRARCREIGFLNTNLSAVGMEKVLYGLHRERFQAQHWVGFKTTSTGTVEQINRLNLLAHRLNLTSVEIEHIGSKLARTFPHDTNELMLSTGLYSNKPGIPSMGIVK